MDIICYSKFLILNVFGWRPAPEVLRVIHGRTVRQLPRPDQILYEIFTDFRLHVFNLICTEDQFKLFKAITDNPELYLCDALVVQNGEPPRHNRKPYLRVLEIVEPDGFGSLKPREQIYHLRLRSNHEYIFSVKAKPEDYEKFHFLMTNPYITEAIPPLVKKGRPKRGTK